MIDRRPFATYNILLPIWLLVWFPSWLWVLLIPANYLVDRLVLAWSVRELDDRRAFCRSTTWKVCAMGFLSDFAGSVLLIGCMVAVSSADSGPLVDVAQALTLNPFSNVFALLITLAAIAVAGVCIFKLDRMVLSHAGLDDERARSAALRLAIITAPYLFLVPATLLYG